MTFSCKKAIMKRTIVSLAIIALCLTACEKEEVVEVKKDAKVDEAKADAKAEVAKPEEAKLDEVKAKPDVG